MEDLESARKTLGLDAQESTGLERRGFVSRRMVADGYRPSANRAPAGKIGFLGPLLSLRLRLHRSSTNRRARLYSYQPFGHPHLRELTGLAASPAIANT